MALITKTRSRASLVMALLVGGLLSSQKQIQEVEAGLFLLLAAESESCNSACDKSGFACSPDSLEAGAPYGISSTIAATVSEIGGECQTVRQERTGRAYPLIDARNRCYSSSIGRTNYDCNFISTMSVPGRRICSCFGDDDGGGSPPHPTPTTPSPTPIDPRNSPFVPNGFTLSWRDDFEGPDLNTTNWSRGLVYDADPSQHVIWNRREGGPHLLNAKYDGYILDEDAYVKNGKLVLANREHSPPIQGTAPTGDFQYSSGWINSLRKRYYNGSHKASYLELRARFPEGPKVWPAIWMVAEEYTWPPEIDIWEYFGVFYNPNWGIDEMHLRNIWGEWRNKETHNIELRFHEYYSGYRTLGWLWTSEEMTWYIDGVEVATKVRGIDIPNEGWPNQDLCLILNNGLMSDVEATTRVNGKATTFPNYLEIDYIALYEKASSNTRVGNPETEYVVLLGEPGESCTQTCSRSGRLCTIRSLVYGDEYTTSSMIEATAASVGASCSDGVHGERDWDVNPQISAGGYCFPTPKDGRTNQDCDASSTLTNTNGELYGRRLCTCESYDAFWA